MIFYAPFVKQCNIQIGLKFKERVNISINQTSIIIGQINQVHLSPNIVFTDGMVDIEKAETIAGIGLDSYHTTQSLIRLNYAKPNKQPTEFVSAYNE